MFIFLIVIDNDLDFLPTLRDFYSFNARYGTDDFFFIVRVYKNQTVLQQYSSSCPHFF